MIPNNLDITVVDDNAATSKVTVTSSNKIRIKIGEFVLPEEREKHIENLTYAAKQAILQGLNVVTLRGKTNRTSRPYIILQDGSKKISCRVEF